MEEKNASAEADVEKKIYEIGFHIVPSVPEDKLGAEVSLLKDVFEKNKAVIISEELPKMRVLAYEMRQESAGKYQKFTSAYFGWIKFEAGAEEALAIELAFKKNPVILRHLLIRTVRENTMTGPRIPSYRRTEAFKTREKEKGAEKTPEKEKEQVSETELDKAIGEAIAE